MTDEEKREFEKIWDKGFGKALDAGISGVDDFSVRSLEINASSEVIDWLNRKMFAYRVIDGKDMFELGLALELTKENNQYENFYEKLTKDFLQAEDIEEMNRIDNIVRTMQNEI